MNIGMVCYASVGGSGVVATELGFALAARGHHIHLISSEPPFRWREGMPGLSFHEVQVPPYPLFREPQYLLALTNTIAHVAEEERLDIVHAHYAVPHATAAYLARQMLDLSSCRPPRTVTTLHGTDITLVGSDPSYRRVVAFSIEQSDAVTTVSRSLRDDTVSALGVTSPIEVIPNFLDCTEYRRKPDPALRARLCPPERYDALVIHISNLRPVKRVGRRARRVSPHPQPRAGQVSRRRRRARPGRASSARRRSTGSATRSCSSASRTTRSRCSRSRICSCCPRSRRASGSRPWKRWPAAFRSWPRRSAACRRSSRTASPGSSARPTTWRGWPSAA